MAISVLSDITGIYAHYRASDLSGTLSDNDPVSTWADQSGGGRDLTASGTDRPTWKADGGDGFAVIRFDGSDFLRAATAADWKFLHDGSDHFGIVVVKIPASPGATFQTVFDTGAHSSSDTGVVLGWDNRGGGSPVEAPIWWVAKGSSPFVIQHTGPSRSMRASNPYSWWHAMGFGKNGSNWAQWTDGIFGGGRILAQSATPSTGNPSGPLTLGRRFSSGGHLTGDIAEVAFWDRALTDEEKAQVFEYV